MKKNVTKRLASQQVQRLTPQQVQRLIDRIPVPKPKPIDPALQDYLLHDLMGYMPIDPSQDRIE